MKAKQILFFAVAALALASCSSDNALTEQNPVQQPSENQKESSVLFDSYVNRATTRSGEIGDLNDTQLRKAWEPTTTYGGFGVFAYYTNNNDYDQMATPNFMYNQLVTYNSTGTGYWQYDPIKYWPNEYGTSAISDDADRVTFFAYAPYVEVTPANGKPTANNRGNDDTGITQISRNTASGYPIVKYVASFDYNKAVDLCWGVCETNTWTLVNDGKQQAFTFGKPWLDVQRPSEAAKQETANQRVKFTFKHALAKLQVNIDAFVDGTDNTNPLDENTRIFVRSIRFNGFAMKGALNLNNETAYQPYWLNYNGVGDLEADGDIVVYDGRRDGKEGMSNSTASNEKSLGLNKDFIQIEGMVDESTGEWKDAVPFNPSTPSTFVPSGVTKGILNTSTSKYEPAPLFDNGGVFYVIPVSGEQVQVEIVYDVETIDANLANTISDGQTPGSSVENHITKNITFGNSTNNSLEAGKAYTINLHLGMNSVKFDAAVVEWDDIKPATDIDLPANMPVVAAKSDANTKVEIAIPGHVNGADFDYYFAASGFVGGENITATEGTILKDPIVHSTGAIPAAGSEDKKANTSGVAYVKAKAKAYTKVVNNPASGSPADGDVKLVGASGINVQLLVKQLAVKLGLYKPASLTAASSYKLQRNLNGSADTWNNDKTDCPVLKAYPGTAGNNYIRVWVNGAELVLKESGNPTGNQFKFDNTDGTITFPANLKAGDNVRVTIKCGDVAEETISFDIAG